MGLRTVVSQQLIPTVDGGLVPAFEILLVNDAVRKIRESKIHQIGGVIDSSSPQGMCDMDGGNLRLYHDGIIPRDRAALQHQPRRPRVLARRNRALRRPSPRLYLGFQRRLPERGGRFFARGSQRARPAAGRRKKYFAPLLTSAAVGI